MTAVEFDAEDVRDLGRAMVLLRGWKVHCDKSMRKNLETLETLCRHCVSLRVVVRAPVDDSAARVDDRGMRTLWMTTKQTAEEMQVSEGLVRKKIRDGELHAVREGRGFRIPRTEFERYVDAKEAGTDE